MSKYRYTEKEFKEAVVNSTSIRQTLQKLNVAGKGGNYDVFRKLAKKYQVDISHFTGNAWNKGQTFAPKRTLEAYLSNKFSIGTNKLKKTTY